MRLHTRAWGPAAADPVLCIHGLCQHGGVFERLATKLADEDRRVTAVDLRGHGGSGHEPPWDLGTHADDLLETLDDAGIESATIVGHSFGGLVAAAAAARAPERVSRLALLDPGIGVSAAQAHKAAEMNRLDWSFGSVEGAVNSLLAAESVVSAPEQTVKDFTESYLERGGDGRLRFRYCPATVVVAWSEMALPPPPVAPLPTLLVRPVSSHIEASLQNKRYREQLGSLLVLKAVPLGHNVLWESPQETAAAIDEFLAATA